MSNANALACASALALARPCHGCPWTAQPGHIKVSRARAHEFATSADAHDRDNEDDDGAMRWEPGMKLCAGSLIFTERVRGHNQIMRIMSRLQRRDCTAELEGGALVWAGVAEMIEGASDR